MKPALQTAGLVFLLIALAHLSRIILKFDVTLNGSPVPIFVNVVAFVASAGLSLWMFKAK